MKKTSTRLTGLALALALLLTSCGGGASATSMHLRKTEGTVDVSDGEGKELTPKENLGLYSGYQVGTQAESYAWIDLDKVKLTKMDAGSEAEIVKEGKKLEINMKSGSLFFNVTEPLADDESMNIRTSTMAVGIRGTCGWVTQDAAALLEGTVSVTAGDQEVTITAGEMAVLTEGGTLEVKPLTAAVVPTFVREEVKKDKKLAKIVQDTTGIDLSKSLEDKYSGAFARIAENGGEVLFAEEVDFEADGSPELLLLYRDSGDREGVRIAIHRGSKKTDWLCDVCIFGERDYYKVSLMESEGRPYVLCYWSNSGGAHAQCYDILGSVAQNDGDYRCWGYVDRAFRNDDLRRGGFEYYSYGRDEAGLAEGLFRDSTAEEYESILQKYTEVRVLVSKG